MKYTNKYNLPDTLANALRADPYSKGAAWKSITQIIGPPQISHLKSQHYHELEEDVSDSVWRLMGSAVHHILESGDAPNLITEERLFVEIDGKTISGAIDVQEIVGQNERVIYDYKVSTKRSLDTVGDKDWETQLNCYAYLVEKAKQRKVVGIKVCLILRDFINARAKNDPTYPQCPIQIVDLPLWSPHDQEQYIRDRIALHQQADDGKVVECTDRDRWFAEGKLAVMKKGGKAAVRGGLYDMDQREEAEAHAETKSELYIEEREGSYRRCEGNYCGVNKFCNQWKGSK
jgi:hypothetical protein